MLIVTIELQSANTGKTSLLGRMLIWNRGDQPKQSKRGNYGVAVLRKGSEIPMGNFVPIAVRRGEVLDYPRSSYNVWRLVLRALRSAFPEETKESRSAAKAAK